MVVTHKIITACRFTVRFNKFAFLWQRYERLGGGEKAYYIENN